MVALDPRESAILVERDNAIAGLTPDPAPRVAERRSNRKDRRTLSIGRRSPGSLAVKSGEKSVVGQFE